MKVHTSHKRLGVNLELTHNELQTIKECKLTSDSDGSLNFKVLSIFLIPTTFFFGGGGSVGGAVNPNKF